MRGCAAWNFGRSTSGRSGELRQEIDLSHARGGGEKLTLIKAMARADRNQLSCQEIWTAQAYHHHGS